MGKEVGKAVVKKVPKGAGDKTLKAGTKRSGCLSASIDGQPVYGIGVALGTALIHILVLLVKAIFFCWIWIWVRWTLPRFRYDHVMNLGWKVILNIALVNLVLTALIAKLLGGI